MVRLLQCVKPPPETRPIWLSGSIRMRNRGAVCLGQSGLVARSLTGRVRLRHLCRRSSVRPCAISGGAAPSGRRRPSAAADALAGLGCVRIGQDQLRAGELGQGAAVAVDPQVDHPPLAVVRKARRLRQIGLPQPVRASAKRKPRGDHRQKDTGSQVFGVGRTEARPLSIRRGSHHRHRRGRLRARPRKRSDAHGRSVRCLRRRHRIPCRHRFRGSGHPPQGQ